MKMIMNFIRKYPKKKVVAVCVSIVMVILLAVLPMAASKRNNDGIKASILSGTAEKGEISSLLIGAGTLSQQDGEKINIPSTVKIKEFLVSNGDRVKKGDDLAEIDRVTLMQAISDIQETMDYLREEMEDAKGESSTDKVIAQRAGTVKAVYAESGDDVQSVMLKKGALAVVSLDGLMSVEIETDEKISAGENVKVVFKDKSTVSGQVKTYLNGVAKITFEDENYTEGTKVTVIKKDGAEIGSGKIQINSRWNATAYSGTVSSVKVSKKEKVSSGEILFTLKNVSSTAKYDNLASQHRDYEELMLSLFEIYQSGTVKSPIDGIVSGIDKESTLLLSNTEGVSVELLANSPDGNDETVYNNYIGKIVSVNDGVWNVNLNAENQTVTDYKNLLEVDFTEEKMTENGNFNPTVPVYELDGNVWKQIGVDEVKTGDILLFAGTGISDIVWAVRVVKGSSTPAETTTQPTTEAPTTTEPSTTAPSTTQPSPPPSNPGGDMTRPNGDVTAPVGGDMTMPSGDDVTMPSGDDVTMPSVGDVTSPSGGDFTLPSGQNQSQGQLPGGSFSGGSFSGGSLGDLSGMMQSENEFELFELEGTTVALVTPQNEMTVSVTVDELDLSLIEIGMTAEITLDAFMGEAFEGTVTNIGTSGENSGGNSKFAVEITMDRAENMLEGMNATAKIVLSSHTDVLTVPVEALCDVGNETVIYTKYNKGEETLEKPVTVTVGASDGEKAEILSGLSEGQEYYYSYYDEYQSVEDTGGFNFMSGFGGMGGGMRRPGR